jgi:hypothetical protein
MLASEAKAGFLASPSAKWTTFSARPEGGEPTPNYFGFAAGLSLGYSVRQVFDLAFNAQFLPARLGNASFGANDSQMIFYGGELGLRIANAVYLGMRAGTAEYRLLYQQREEELPGRWSGPAGGVSLGAIHGASKDHFFQTSLDFLHAVTTRQDSIAGGGVQETGKRRFDAISISFAYVFNSYNNERIQNTIFKDFLDSISFQ